MTTTFSRYEMFAVHVNYNNWSRDFLKNCLEILSMQFYVDFFLNKTMEKNSEKLRKKGNVSFSIGKQ